VDKKKNAEDYLKFYCKRDSFECNKLIPDVLRSILEVMKRSMQVPVGSKRTRDGGAGGAGGAGVLLWLPGP